MLESLLESEKTAYAKLQQNLNTTNDELVWLRKEKDMHNQNYLEVLEKVTEFRVLFQQAQEKNKGSGNRAGLWEGCYIYGRGSVEEEEWWNQDVRMCSEETICRTGNFESQGRWTWGGKFNYVYLIFSWLLW